jgi:hypothetical protein
MERRRKTKEFRARRIHSQRESQSRLFFVFRGFRNMCLLARL